MIMEAALIAAVNAPLSFVFKQASWEIVIPASTNRTGSAARLFSILIRESRRHGLRVRAELRGQNGSSCARRKAFS